jgi:hypothetical protein
MLAMLILTLNSNTVDMVLLKVVPDTELLGMVARDTINSMLLTSCPPLISSFSNPTTLISTTSPSLPCHHPSPRKKVVESSSSLLKKYSSVETLSVSPFPPSGLPLAYDMTWLTVTGIQRFIFLRSWKSLAHSSTASSLLSTSCFFSLMLSWILILLLLSLARWITPETYSVRLPAVMSEDRERDSAMPAPM